ncbi:MAG: DNA-formamidopyrimidine glycosylase family protein, partial [bacterium]
MPELPEATTISSQLSPFIVGKKLKNVTIKKASIIKNSQMLPNLINLECIEVGNYGKMIYFKFPGYWIVFMLALTGYLVINPKEELYKYSIVEFNFDNVVVFGAKRMFEKMIVYNVYPFEKYGPDFRNISALDFIKRMVKTKKYVKVALMDQKVIAGIGNIYACEALFEAGISPTRYTNNITAQEYY